MHDVPEGRVIRGAGGFGMGWHRPGVVFPLAPGQDARRPAMSDVGEVGCAALPDFSFATDDLHRTTDDDLRRRALADQATLALWLMRDARNGTALLQRIAHWADGLERLARDPGGQDAIIRLLRYIAHVSDDLHLSQFRDIVKGRAPWPSLNNSAPKAKPKAA